MSRSADRWSASGSSLNLDRGGAGRALPRKLRVNDGFALLPFRLRQRAQDTIVALAFAE